jgi:hypothetical protein
VLISISRNCCRLQHQNIIMMLETFETVDQIVVVTEIADGGSSPKKYPVHVVWVLVWVSLGLPCVHQASFIVW